MYPGCPPPDKQPIYVITSEPEKNLTMSSLERIALFIDGANLYASAKALGFDIDYKRLLKEFQGKGRLIRAFYYTALGRRSGIFLPSVLWSTGSTTTVIRW